MNIIIINSDEPRSRSSPRDGDSLGQGSAEPGRRPKGAVVPDLTALRDKGPDWRLLRDLNNPSKW